MPSANLVHSTAVEGPAGRHVRVMFYDDASIRFRVTQAGPMKISEAFLTGDDKHVIIKLDPAEPLYFAPEAALIPQTGSALVERQPLAQGELVPSLIEAFHEVISNDTRLTGSASLGYLGVFENYPGPHWTGWVNLAEGMAWLGVTFIGLKYGDWPIARFLLREQREPELLSLAVASSDQAFLNVWRSAWQGGGRLPRFLEQNITPLQGVPLSQLSRESYAAILDEALSCLNPSRQYRGWGRRQITLLSGRTKESLVAPEMQFRVRLRAVTSQNDLRTALSESKSLLHPIHGFLRQRSLTDGK